MKKRLEKLRMSTREKLELAEFVAEILIFLASCVAMLYGKTDIAILCLLSAIYWKVGGRSAQQGHK